MKCIKCLTTLFLVFYLIIYLPVVVFAADVDFVTEALSDEEISEIVKNRKFEKITTYTPLTVKCFDVRNDHMLVVGADVGNTAVIAVYNSCGEFQYGFKTEESGSFRVMWSGETITYYCIRSAYVFEINESGQIVNICRAANTKENRIFDRESLLSKTKKVDSSIYSMTNENAFFDAISVSFKKIIKTDATETVVIYDASSDQYTHIVIGILGCILVSPLLINGIIEGIKRHRKKYGNST